MKCNDLSKVLPHWRTARGARRGLAVASLIAAGTLSVAAQRPVETAIVARATGRATISRAAVAKLRISDLTSIQGNALSSTNGPLSNVDVRLRDARFGRIVDMQQTDKSGLFAFNAIDPGSYIVEVMANDQSVLAASQLLNVSAGEAVSAIVKLPFGLAGSSITPSATVIAAQAAAFSIIAVAPTAPISPLE